MLLSILTVQVPASHTVESIPPKMSRAELERPGFMKIHLNAFSFIYSPFNLQNGFVCLFVFSVCTVY